MGTTLQSGPRCQFSSSFPKYENTKHFAKPKCKCVLLSVCLDQVSHRPPEGEGEKTLHPGVASPSGIGCMCSIRTRQDVPRFHQPWFDFKQVCPHLHSLCCPLETFRDTEAHFIVICLREPSQGSNFRIPAHAWQLFEFKQVVSSLSTLFSSSFFFSTKRVHCIKTPLSMLGEVWMGWCIHCVFQYMNTCTVPKLADAQWLSLLLKRKNAHLTFLTFVNGKSLPHSESLLSYVSSCKWMRSWVSWAS